MHAKRDCFPSFSGGSCVHRVKGLTPCTGSEISIAKPAFKEGDYSASCPRFLEKNKKIEI